MKPSLVFYTLVLFLSMASLSWGIKEGELSDVDKIIFYAIPQSHTDAGWYWTYEYYFSLASGILDSVTDYLIAHPDKRFTWSDHSFFRKWYMTTIKGNSEREKNIKKLVAEGKLDLINGGLVQNDEAGPLIKETYTNFEEGLQFLVEEFGVRPDTVWQLDPFGFSSSTPEILKSLGFDKVIINRISDAYKHILRENQDLDFIWKGDGDEEIYTRVLHGHYGVDIAFYMDRRWYAASQCPNPLDEACVKKLIAESIHQGVKVHNRTGYVMQLLGNDFFFSNAQFSFDYIDGMKSSLESMGPRLLNVSKVEFRYATLSEYLNDVLKLNYTIGRYDGDFFVYTQYQPSSYYDHHWGGYFASRPMFKWMVRSSLSRERILNSLFAVLSIPKASNSTHFKTAEFDSAFDTLKKVREFNPIMLHHDAITGTHGTSVNIDYKRKIQANQDLMDQSVEKLKGSLSNDKILTNDIVEYTFYNPSLYTRDEILNVTVKSQYYEMVNHTHIEAEIMDSYSMKEEDFTQDKEYILWIKMVIPPLSIKKVYLKEHRSKTECERAHNCILKVKTEEFNTVPSDLTLQNDLVYVDLRENALEVKYIRDLKEKTTAKINESMYKYDGLHTNSCMYTFKPTKEAELVNLFNQKYIRYTGNLVTGLQVHGDVLGFYFDKTVMLKKNDCALHITTRNFIKTRFDIELTLRYQEESLENYYTGDSMAFIKRDFINYQTAIERNLTRSNSRSNTDILGLNAYPMVDGFISTYNDGMNVGFVNSQTCAAHLVNSTSYEFLIARSVMNVNQDKGLPERLYDKYQTHFNYKIFVNNNATQFYD